MSKISTEWLRGLNPDESESLKKVILGNNFLLSRLEKILIEKLDAIEREEGKLDLYTDGYPFKQAFLNGKKKNLQDTIKLLGL